MPSPNRRSSPVRTFLATEVAGGVVLLGATAAALLWANGPWRSTYPTVWTTHLSVGPAHHALSLDLRHWVNDALMTFFFLVVGLEIKRELVAGELRDRRTVRLAVFAAMGGMAVPAAIYLAFNAGGPGRSGWGVPMATDIAFSLGVMALLGRRVPPAVRLFLLTMAVVDDLGSLVVVAAAYSKDVNWAALAAAAVMLGVLVVFGRLPIGGALLYVPAGLALWVALHAAGVQAATSGALLGLTAPAAPSHPVVERMESALHPWASFVIAPVFALANAGVALSGAALHAALASPVTAGVFVGRIAGKAMGVTGAAWLACRLGLASLPRSMTWRQVLGVACLAGIGFTVALFIIDVGLAGALAAQARVGVLAAAGVAAVAGALVLRN